MSALLWPPARSAEVRRVGKWDRVRTGMKDDECLVLLAWPRSGSSGLWQILRAHPDLRLLPDEPFNESFTEWSPGNPDYLARIRDIGSLDLARCTPPG